MNFANFLLDVSHVFWLNRAGRMMRKVTVKFKVERDELTGQALKDAWKNQAGHTIASIDDDFQGFDFADIYKRKNMVDIIINNIALSDLTMGCWFREVPADREVADLSQA